MSVYSSTIYSSIQSTHLSVFVYVSISLPFYLSFFLSISFYHVYLSTHLSSSAYLSVPMNIYVSIELSISVYGLSFMHPSIHPSTWPNSNPSVLKWLVSILPNPISSHLRLIQSSLLSSHLIPSHLISSHHILQWELHNLIWPTALNLIFSLLRSICPSWKKWHTVCPDFAACQTKKITPVGNLFL